MSIGICVCADPFLLFCLFVRSFVSLFFFFIFFFYFFCVKVRAVAVQVMEVVYGVKDNDWLVKLLRGMIFGPAGGDKQKKV